MTEQLTIRLLQGDDVEMAALQHVLESAPAYAERVTGPRATEAAAFSAVTHCISSQTLLDLSESRGCNVGNH